LIPDSRTIPSSEPLSTEPLLQVADVSLAAGQPRSPKTGNQDNTPPAHYLLQGISFQVFAGDCMGLVGPSGSGKTSLLRVLNRLNEPLSGAVYFENRKLSQLPVVQLRQAIVLVLQESKLLGMTVQQALEYPLVLRKQPAHVIQQRVGEWIERLYIPADWLERTELQLSVGQRQLVAIARALVAQPRLLLLDEPTAALDVGRSQTLLTVLKELTQQGQMTVLMANHQLEMVQQVCTRVLHLNQGKLAQDAASNQIDWPALRHNILTAETQQTQEWG